METVEHWWNGVVAGMARQDVFLQRLADDTWRVDWQWWPDRYATESYVSEATARMRVADLKAKGALLPGREWTQLGKAKRPRR